MHPVQRRIAKGFYIAHGITIILGLGFLLCGIFTDLSEKGSLADFKLKNLHSDLVKICYFTSGALVVSAGLGLAAQLRGNKPSLWIIYCLIMGVMTLVELAVGGSAISKAGNNPSTVGKELLANMDTYTGEDKTSNWDVLQRTRECCAVNNFTDWQTVQFGRTSLKVPISCCLPHLREDIYCGQNLLPQHVNASELIYVRGCLKLLISAVDRNLYAMGIYGIIVSFLQLLLVSTASYLMITKQL